MKRVRRKFLYHPTWPNELLGSQNIKNAYAYIHEMWLSRNKLVTDLVEENMEDFNQGERDFLLADGFENFEKDLENSFMVEILSRVQGQPLCEHRFQ